MSLSVALPLCLMKLLVVVRSSCQTVVVLSAADGGFAVFQFPLLGYLNAPQRLRCDDDGDGDGKRAKHTVSCISNLHWNKSPNFATGFGSTKLKISYLEVTVPPRADFPTTLCCCLRSTIVSGVKLIPSGLK